MKRILITTIGIICCILNAVSAEKLVSHFQDTSEQCALQKNMVVDYGAKPDSPEDQSAIWQNAIEDLSASGGGRLIVPKGNYHIVEIRMCSNVHLVIEAGTVLTLSSLKRKTETPPCSIFQVLPTILSLKIALFVVTVGNIM